MYELSWEIEPNDFLGDHQMYLWARTVGGVEYCLSVPPKGTLYKGHMCGDPLIILTVLRNRIKTGENYQV
jgi:hypothetical protein